MGQRTEFAGEVILRRARRSGFAKVEAVLHPADRIFLRDPND